MLSLLNQLKKKSLYFRQTRSFPLNNNCRIHADSLFYFLYIFLSKNYFLSVEIQSSHCLPVLQFVLTCLLNDIIVLPLRFGLNLTLVLRFCFVNTLSLQFPGYHLINLTSLISDLETFNYQFGTKRCEWLTLNLCLCPSN